MGFWIRTPEEKEAAREKAEIRQQKVAIYTGTSLQPIGKIAVNDEVSITFKPDSKVLNIRNVKADITIPFERMVGFKTESEVSLKKAGNSLGGALIGGALAGGVGAIIGAGKNKGKTDIKWISTLIYKDKENNIQELYFIDRGITGPYKGDKISNTSAIFANVFNKIVSNLAEDITEL